MTNLDLHFFGSEYIVNYLRFHPVDWSDLHLSRRGGAGDQAGVTPTPAVAEFLALLKQNGDLFTQREYEEHCRRVWCEWFNRLPEHLQRGVIAKLHNNFYPSMIDTLHVYALLVEERIGDCYIVSPEMDARDKIDLIVKVNGQAIGLALIGPTDDADHDRAYKTEHRPGIADDQLIVVKLPNARPRTPGNKRWYQLQDFQVLLEIMAGI